MDFVKGTISGTTIIWSSPNTVFKAHPTAYKGEGFDFPSIAVDTAGLCYILARHYTGGASGVEVKRSLDSTCSTWTSTSVLLQQSSFGAVRDWGGYIVPLTNGKVYAVFKDDDGTTGQLYGQLYYGRIEPRETIDSSAGLGVYEQGMSVLAVGDTVYLAWIHSDGSVRFAVRTLSWAPFTTLDNRTSFYTPGLSLDAGTGSLYLFYRTLSSFDAADAQVFEQVAVNSGGKLTWSGPNLLVSSSWCPVFVWENTPAGEVWALTTNYSSNGRVLLTYVDGSLGVATLPVK